MESNNQLANLDIFKFLPTAHHQLREKRCELDQKCTDHALLKMLEEGLHTDITLIAKGGSVKAHRSVLASVSPVFCAMFERKRKVEQLTFTVDIPDMTIDGLELFLLAIYTTNEYSVYTESGTETMPPLFSDAIDKHFSEIWEAAHHYQVLIRLKTVLLPALYRKLTPENCWDFYNSSLLVLSQLNPSRSPSNSSVREPFSSAASSVCRHYILDNYNDVIKSASILKEMKRNPKRVQSIMIEAEPS